MRNPFRRNRLRVRVWKDDELVSDHVYRARDTLTIRHNVTASATVNTSMTMTRNIRIEFLEA